MPKSINVFLNSTLAVSGNSQSATYYFDWSAVLDRKKKYKMHFTYLGGQNTYTGSKLALVYLGINSNSFAATGNGAPYTQCIGFLKPIVLVGSTNTVYLQCEDTTNLPVHFDSCPMNNTFTVEIRTNDGALWTDNAGTPAIPANYILTLKFTEVNEMEE